MVQSGRVLIVRDYEVSDENGGEARQAHNKQHLESRVDLKLDKYPECVAAQLAVASFCN
jgi:hypothetical protein